MFQSPPRGRAAASWIAFALWAMAIYATVPFARAIQRWADQQWGPGALRWISIALIVLGAVAVCIQLQRRVKHLPWPRIAVVLGVCAVFVWMATTLMQTPAEAVHFVEYGVLSLLAFRALAHRDRDPLINFNAVLLCSLASTVDEFAQWLTPGRYWDLRDLLHNTAAALLVQIALAAGIRPPFIQRPIRRPSVRLAAALVAAQALLLGLCASNTPVAAARLSDRFPALAFLLDNDHAMSEYGFRYDAPDIGGFYSRYAPEDLAYLDAERGAEVGPILRHYTVSEPYTNFLARYTPARDPYAHEVMVHLYRRNHYFGVLPKYRFEPEWYRFHVTVAFRENQILERYFSNTLAHSAQAWTEELKEALAAHVNAEPRYVSAVSQHLIHRVSERQVWGIVALVLLLCAAVWFRARWGAHGDAGDNPV
ncbi:MAG TPA: VanZ family protein [Kiritimatiellia bacterium]|nr:VanZ family protein [Kiritimatiellia bacterium]